MRASTRCSPAIPIGMIKRIALLSLASLFFLIVQLGLASADTLDWATRPTTNLLTTTDNATVNSVTIQTSGSLTGTFSPSPPSNGILPTTSANGSGVGIIATQMDATTDNGTATETVTFTFSEPVYNLTILVRDIDGGPTCFCNFTDQVNFTSDAGVPTSFTAAAGVTYNSTTGIALANQNATISDTSGNLSVTFAGPVTTASVTHVAANNNNVTNPAFQVVIVDDLDYERSPRLTISKAFTPAGAATTFNFSVSNSGSGSTATTVAVPASGAATLGTQIRLNAASTATTVTETGPSGWAMSGSTASCSDSNSANSGNPASFTAPIASNGLSFTIPAGNIRGGAVLTCAVTNLLTTVKFQKQTIGGTASFSFNTPVNLASAPATIDTSVSNPGPTSPVAINVSTIGSQVELTEAAVAGYALTGFSCTDANSAITGNTGTFGSFNAGTGVVTIPAVNIVMGADLTCTVTNTKLPTVAITKISNGGTAAFTFNGDNGFGAAQTITTITSGVGVSGSIKTLAAAGTSTILTETVPTGYQLASISCTGLGSGSATPNLSAGTVTLDSTATAAGNNIDCTFTNTKLPTVTITKVSNGATGAFTFNGDNGFGAAQTITTVTSGVAVSGATRTLSAASTITTLTETIPTGYALTAATCTGIGTGTATANLSAGTITLNALATAAGNNVACTFTNTKLPTVTISKISNGDVGAFTFNGDNGFGAAQTITTITSGVAVSGASRTLSAASTITTLTETIPAGYALTAATCTGIGSGTATANLPSGIITLNALATAAGNAINCTFTNTKLPTVTISKISNGGTGAFTFNGDNGFGAAQTITTVTSGVAVSGAARTLSAASTNTTLTETIPAGYALTAASCTGIGSGAATANLLAGTITLNALATAAGNNIACTFTNTKLPTVTITKVSNGGTGAFSFTGTNGFSNQTITTLSSGVGVAGATQTLSTASTTTSITETSLAGGFLLDSISCSGLGAGGTASTNLATATVSFDASATAPGSAIFCTFVNGTASLTVVKTGTLNDGGDGIVNAGDTITYTFAITNTGTVTLTNVSASDSGATVSGGPIASLAPGITDSTTISGTHILTQSEIDSGSYANTVTITGNPPTGPPVTANDTETIAIPSVPTFTIVKAQTAGPNPVSSLPATLAYTITVDNTGNRTLTAPLITDTLVQGTVGLSLTSGPSLSSGDTDSDNALDTNETWVYSASYTVTQANLDDGDPIDNVATFDSAESSPLDSAPVSTPISQSEAISITKTGSLDNGGDGVANAGDTIQYTFSITNSGNVTLTNVTVSDPLATVSGSPIASLAPGATDNSTYTAVYVLTQADLDSNGGGDGDIDNTAQVSGTPPSGPDISDTDSEATAITQVPGLSMVKTGSTAGPVGANDVINYTYTVTNTGNVTIQGVTVNDIHNGHGTPPAPGGEAITTDQAPLGDSTDAAANGSWDALAPGDSISFTSTYTVTQTDVDLLQ